VNFVNLFCERVKAIGTGTANIMEANSVHSYDPKKYVEYQKGTIPIILTSPHGGKLLLPGVQIRSRKGCCNVSDSNTNSVVDLVASNLESLYGVKPYFVKGLAKRKYCDLNRHCGVSFPLFHLLNLKP
jgi:hypothetical protein